MDDSKIFMFPDGGTRQTVTVPYQPFQAIPNCVAYQYGMYNNGNLNGFWL